MASTSTIDALPYYDKQVDDPARKSAAQALIDAELKSVARIEEDDPRLPPKVELFPRSKELQDLADGYPETPIRGIDPSKYNPPVIGPEASLEELIEADKRVRIGQGHMSIRNENASILSSFGPNAWLVRNYQLNGELKELEGVLQGLKDKVTDVNRSRRVFQEATGDHLTRLESRWQDLVGSTVQLEMACGALEGEVRGLKRKEQELKSQVTALEQA